MESRKRRSRYINRQYEMKLLKLDRDVNNSQNCVNTGLTMSVPSSLSGKLPYLRSAIQRKTMSTRKTIQLSRDRQSKYSHQTSEIGNDHDMCKNAEHVQVDSKIKSRVFVRDDSGYQSDESIESPADQSDTDESVASLEDNSVKRTTGAPTEYCEHGKTVVECLIDEGNSRPSLTISKQKIYPVKPDSHKDIRGEIIHETSETRKHSSDEDNAINNDDGNSDDDDDDESDVIIINDATESASRIQPKAIDKRSSWSRNSLDSPVETRLFKYGTLTRKSSLPERFFLHANNIVRNILQLDIRIMRCILHTSIVIYDDGGFVLLLTMAFFCNDRTCK